MAIMQKGADRTQKFERGRESLAYRLRKQRFLGRPGVLLIDGGEQRKPTRHVVVTQSLEELAISSDKAAIEKRDGEFDIPLVELIALRQSSCRRPQFHVQVP